MVAFLMWLCVKGKLWMSVSGYRCISAQVWQGDRCSSNRALSASLTIRPLDGLLRISNNRAENEVERV